MPIYEYRCNACRRRVSIFFRSFSAVGEAACPRCGGGDLTRLMSRVSVIRGREGGNGGDDGGGDDDDLGGEADMLAGLDEDDPRSVARWARRMSAEMGEAIEPEFDEALTRIEAGEDPDRVMEEIDGGETGMAGAADGAGDDSLD